MTTKRRAEGMRRLLAAAADPTPVCTAFVASAHPEAMAELVAWLAEHEGHHTGDFIKQEHREWIPDLADYLRANHKREREQTVPADAGRGTR